MTSRLRHDLLIALALAVTLGLIWTWRDWANVAALRLPDTDDIMRLQQVRDLLAGQSWFDLTQHRLAGGLPMHWTRLGDLGPALVIAVLAPLTGAHTATVAAVVAWPIALFAVALFLIARIARAVGGEALAGTAAIVAAIAYPATTIFTPGRIDHHGLQIVLLLAATLALVTRPTPPRAALAGLAAAASLVIGLETAPLLAILAAIMLIDWVTGRDRDGEPLAAFAVGAFGGLVIGRIAFASAAFAFPACDGFTRDAWTAALTLAAAPILLASLSQHATGWRPRLALGLSICAAASALALARSPACLAPYGRVDPLLADVWLSQVEEAQSILSASWSAIIGYCGIMAAGVAASLWQVRGTATRGWTVLLALQVAALAISLVQLRGAYAGAMLAAPALAATIRHARVRGTMRLAMAWTLSAGIVYPLAGQALARRHAPRAVVAMPQAGDCTSPALLASLARLPTGTVLAPVDAGPAVRAATPHNILAAPYHRNASGTLAAYRYYLGPIGAAPPATYILACAAMPGIDRPGSVGSRLARGDGAGLTRVATFADGAAIYTARLSKGPRSL